MNTYEVEIKSLLGEEKNADSFRSLLSEKGAQKKSQGSQLNHYFLVGDMKELLNPLVSLLNENQTELLTQIIEHGKDHSVRTREADGKVMFVVKASVDDNSSDNGVARMEFEEALDISLADLDNILLEAGFEYQAKWSRKREEYELDGVVITLDKNAGYGWLTEFEIVVDTHDQLSSAEEKIRNLMSDFNVHELSQERIGRMFEYYNKNWRDYYGTENIFTLE